MEFTTSKRANTERNQNHETHMQIQEHFTELSIRLSEVLDNSGAGKDTVMVRRGSYLWLERMANLHTQLTGYNFECFHFGSQSEGTTIPGLQSDIDILFSNNSVNIMRVWGDWEPGMENFMMLHDETTPPQQYLLQVISKEAQKPETGLCDDTVRKDSRQVLYSAERYLSDLENTAKNIAETTKSGPSVSFIPNWDMVYAFHVRKPLHEILHWIDRCKCRHWPPVLLLEAASVSPCFLVPSGHPDSDYKREEWRLSPNLIERMLIFSFNMTQIKCYIVLKLIKKSLFAKIVGDSITSFHCKTIMFYTMERTHPSLWFEHNLMYLLLHCLRMLRTWLRFGRLPHYIIQGVNLFDGKLSKVKQRRLLVYIDSMIRNNLQDVFNIDIENIGCRLQGCYIRRIGQTRASERLFVCNSINIQLNYECFKTFLGWCKRIIQVNQINNSNTTFEKTIQYVLRNAVECSTNARLKNVALVFLKHVHRLQNSMQSSDCLRLRKVVTKQLIRRFQYSLNTDVASSHLKLASVLYCSGHIIAAVRVLEDVERRFHNRVKAVCECRSIEGQSDLHVFANMSSGNSDKGFSESPFSLCVKFVTEEAYCVPTILLFEMNRNITKEEVTLRTNVEILWMGSAEVDARPFLHYLQYLTYGGLSDRDNQLHALRALGSYIYNIRNINKINLYHLETALNMLGHCHEMEGEYDRALDNYEISLGICGTNNAANWHVRRVLRLISG